MSGLGLKYDDGKNPWHLLPLETIEDVVKVLAHGAKKYGPNNWQNVPDGYNRYFSAMMRHIMADRSGEYLDPESGLPHLSHALCSLMFLTFIRHRDGHIGIEEMVEMHPDMKEYIGER